MQQNSNSNKLIQFHEKINNAIIDNQLIKISLGDYKGDIADLKQIFIKKVLIKGNELFSFVFRYKTKDITKNFDIEETLSLLKSYIQTNACRVATLFTTQENTILQCNQKDKWNIKIDQVPIQKSIPLTHNKIKNHKINAINNAYLPKLGITNKDGHIFNHAQDKFKQINHYIEILSSLLENLPQKEQLKAVDMGSGKGYLTFALYDYLTHQLQKNVAIEGIEFRKDMVELCNAIAKEVNFNHLSFEENTIEDYQPQSDIDILIALHACDTATDDAIHKGITHNAALIVVAPCCHKQIRREIEKSKMANALTPLTRFGILLERQAEMVTDGIRALILEYFGYSTKVFDFISEANTPKNVLVVGEKKSTNDLKKEEIAQKIKDLKQFFGIETHYLETKFNLKF